MKKIIISGATGMIGATLSQSALECGLEVLCIVRKDSSRLECLPKSPHLCVVYAALADYSNLQISGKYDAFFHLAWDKTFGAARDDVDTQLKNIQYTLDAVRLAKEVGCSVFVGAGSQAEYGIVSKPLTPDMSVNPESGYGIAKYAAGKLSKLLCAQLAMRHNWVRIISAFGKLDSSKTLIMYAINELRAGRSPEFTKCEQMWDYIYCDDVASAFLAVAERGLDGKTYPLGSGKSQRLSEYLEALKNIVNPDGILQFGKKDYYAHQPMCLCADTTELTADTGWKPVVGFEEGIKRIITSTPIGSKK